MASQLPDADEGFDAVATARRLMLSARTASLGTLAGDGAPYVSLIEIAPDIDGAPLTLISRLAIHTGNLFAVPRAAILIDERCAGDPLRQARLSLTGRAAQVDGEGVKNLFVAHNPTARLYAGFADFSVWRLEVEGAHLVAGFGRIVDLSPADILVREAAGND